MGSVDGIWTRLVSPSERSIISEFKPKRRFACRSPEGLLIKSLKA